MCNLTKREIACKARNNMRFVFFAINEITKSRIIVPTVGRTFALNVALRSVQKDGSSQTKFSILRRSILALAIKHAMLHECCGSISTCKLGLWRTCKRTAISSLIAYLDWLTRESGGYAKNYFSFIYSPRFCKTRRKLTITDTFS